MLQYESTTLSFRLCSVPCDTLQEHAMCAICVTSSRVLDFTNLRIMIQFGGIKRELEQSAKRYRERGERKLRAM